MPSTNFTEILRLLPKLSATEREEVRKRCVLLSGTSSEEAVDKVDWLYDGIITVLRKRGALSPTGRPSLNQLYRLYPNYRSQADETKSVLLGGIKFKPNPPELHTLGVLAADALARDLEGWAGICLETMMQRVSTIPGAIDKCYPSYLRYGLLGMMLREK